MPYIIIDNQGMGTHQDEVFDTKEEILEHLIDYHSVDYEGEIPLEKFSLKHIQDYGEWNIKKISRRQAQKIRIKADNDLSLELSQ